ncbi:NAD-dependent deacetylase [Lactobacillus colini]|uniref:protein acetyllysine N-acetyltransferase n=1 Tax=Lactobacillus colini TaxID=1819254 RepID=A0ABS4MCV0_9LACO|nr:NAD-dependent protein deacylase [Lactobacillus colini]MBP2057476.1 NAD-dependent deacetylase [Lactobacillus colini]
MLKDKLTQLQNEIASAKHITYLTGAGVSTHSGIPDYRSKGGIYDGVAMPPEQILSDDTLYNAPEQFHDFVMNNMYFPNAKPNLIHNKIAQSCNKNGQLITQNVDGLDKKAGNQHVIEFHGNLYDIFCTKCQKSFTYDEYKSSYIHQQDQGIIRPGIVLYGEAIDQTKLMQSVNAIQNSNLIIICGTSFVVYPFAQLLTYRNPSARVWAINKTPLAQDAGINAIIGDALDVFSQLEF